LQPRIAPHLKKPQHDAGGHFGASEKRGNDRALLDSDIYGNSEIFEGRTGNLVKRSTTVT